MMAELRAFTRTIQAAAKALPAMWTRVGLWARVFPGHLHLERGRMGIGRWAHIYGPQRTR